VEAAGVEPASESTSSQASTCVAALESSRAPSKSGGNRRPLAPRRLAAARRNRPRRPACFYDIQSPPDRHGRGGRRCLIKQRERAACPQLRCVPPDLRVDGARHASRDSLPPSKPYRPHRRGVAARRSPCSILSSARRLLHRVNPYTSGADNRIVEACSLFKIRGRAWSAEAGAAARTTGTSNPFCTCKLPYNGVPPIQKWPLRRSGELGQ